MECSDESNCYDVCTNQCSVTPIDWREELRTATDAIDTIRSKGELKIAQYVQRENFKKIAQWI